MSAVPYRRVFFQTIVSVLLSVLTFAFGFVRVYFFSKELSMEQFGVLSLLLTMSSFMVYILTLGSFQYLFRNVNTDVEKCRPAFWISILATAALSLLSVLIVTLFGHKIANALNLKDYYFELVLMIVGTGLTSIMTVLQYFHYGLSRNNLQNFLQFLRGSLWVVVSVVTGVLFGLSLVKILIIFNVCIAFVLLLSIPWRELYFLMPLVVSRQSVQELWKYCLPLLPYFAGVWGIPMIVRSQLNIYQGAKEVALFSVAYTLMEIVFMFVSTISNTLTPYFFSELKEDNKPGLFYNLMLKCSVVAILLILPFIFILRYDIILIVSSEKYLPAGDFIPLLIFFPLLRVLITVFEQYFLKVSKTLYLGITYIIGIVLCLILTIILIPLYSVYGAILASLIAYGLILILLSVKQMKLVDFAYQRIPAQLTLLGILWGMVYLLSFFEFSNFYKIFPLGICALISLFLVPIFDTRERKKFFSLLGLK